jgi:hypothetical protein
VRVGLDGHVVTGSGYLAAKPPLLSTYSIGELIMEEKRAFQIVRCYSATTTQLQLVSQLTRRHQVIFFFIFVYQLGIRYLLTQSWIFFL